MNVDFSVHEDSNSCNCCSVDDMNGLYFDSNKLKQ